jgi:hypothetical protein
MRQEDEINGADKIDKAAGRTRQAQWSVAQSRQNAFDG